MFEIRIVNKAKVKRGGSEALIDSVTFPLFARSACPFLIFYLWGSTRYIEIGTRFSIMHIEINIALAPMREPNGGNGYDQGTIGREEFLRTRERDGF